ncbi:inactive transglutaminase family protein [Shewanella gelidii]|uniref:Gonadoliberin III n=1 Tax=Shewanella gelidii TaxID=1642821 RepID=A0A917JUZ0_9GAMM|nr:inactive transglutaminase family protein [Shewanella gelidii]MCL1097956.1 inactive transglutaminase family protein [Shewanella gelidii]GGI84974.1 gonadoliberin III [Shewanella gelidii]
MQTRTPFYALVAALIILGIGASIYRGIEHDVPFVPGEQLKSWSIDAKVSFRAKGEPVEVSFSLPSDPAFEILVENTTSPGYGLSIQDTDQGRRAVWSVREAYGNQQLYYKVTLIPTGLQRNPTEQEAPKVRPVSWPDTEADVAQQVLADAWERSANNLSFANQLMQLISEQNRSQNISLLLSNYSPNSLFIKLLKEQKIPARIVHGLHLEDQRRRQQLEPYVEVFSQGHWHFFDVKRNKQTRPNDLLLWEREDSSVLDVVGGSKSQVNFSMLQESRSALSTAIDMMDPKSFDFSLYQLPLEEQSLFKGILLIPIGVLVVVFLRVIIGIKTSGTFMPVLIALAFIQTSLVTGLVGFLLIVACGLMIRSYLSHLNLLLISRISAVIIVVIGIIGVFTLLSYKFGLSEGLTITFFPMIILAWTIERMSILWEEEGVKEVVVQGGGSLFVATIAYLAMSSVWVQHWVFNFLGMHAVILGLVLLMGQYTGYRLLELKRFKPLAGDKQ